MATLVGTAYNLLVGNPFRTYGETALILFQNCIIVALVWHFTKEPQYNRWVCGCRAGKRD